LSNFVCDPYSRELDSDPFPIYKRLRDEYPCYWSEPGDCWMLTRYADVTNAARNWEVFSSASGNMLDDIPERTGVTLGTTDPPRHDHMRSLIQFAFGRQQNEYLVEPTREIANKAIDKALEAGHLEFISDYSSPVTIGALSYLLGIPQDQSETLRAHVVQILQTDPETRKKTQASMDSFQWLKEYTGSLLAARREKPTDDLLTYILQAEIDGKKMQELEVQMTSLTLIMAGVESASSFMAMLALNLADHPDAQRRLVNDPQLMPQVMEESLRYNTSAQRFRRTASRDFELHGETIRAGDKVMNCYGAANRDERQFPDPDTYDIDRRPKQHLGMGTGKHVCIGAPFARMLVRTAMSAFHERIPEYHRVADQLDWIPSTTFRSPVALDLELP